jgi:lysyl-tRNA synthetase class II
MDKIKITIGDWSQDGHNQYEEFVFEANKTVQEIRQAYKDSCKLTGLSFNHNEDYTGLNLNWQHPEYETRKIATEYEEYELSDLAKEILSKFNIDYSNYNEEPSLENFIDLLINFIKLSLPDLILEEASFKKSELKTIKPLNGWWTKELNCQFGYGLFN